MVANIDGVVLSFVDQQGIILLRHRSAPSLTFVVDMYLDPTLKYPLWLAEFTWADIDGESREMIMACYQKAPKQRRMPKKTTLTLSKWMVGRVVKCNVRKRTDSDKLRIIAWEAIQIAVDFHQDQHDLPSYSSMQKKRQAAESGQTDRVTQRISRFNQSSPNNLKRPWRG